MDIVEQALNEQHDVYAKAREEYRKVIQQQRDEIEQLRWENANMEKLWGKSEGTWMEIRDKQDAEIERLREVVMLLVSYDEHDEEIQKGAVMWDVLIEAAHAALKEKE